MVKVSTRPSWIDSRSSAGNDDWQTALSDALSKPPEMMTSSRSFGSASLPSASLPDRSVRLSRFATAAFSFLSSAMLLQLSCCR